MTATNPIRVVQWGLGAMGQGMAKLITSKDGLDLVGAIDVNPALDGKDVGEVLGIDSLGVHVTTDPSTILDSDKVDVVTIATTSWVRDQIADLRTITTAGINVVSIAEEMSCPEAQNPEMAKELDELAKSHGVSAVGVGVNPGFVLDHLVVALCSGGQEVTHIEARRVNDLAPYGETVLRTQGVGTPPRSSRPESPTAPSSATSASRNPSDSSATPSASGSTRSSRTSSPSSPRLPVLPATAPS